MQSIIILVAVAVNSTDIMGIFFSYYYIDNL